MVQSQWYFIATKLLFYAGRLVNYEDVNLMTKTALVSCVSRICPFGVLQSYHLLAIHLMHQAETPYRAAVSQRSGGGIIRLSFHSEDENSGYDQGLHARFVREAFFGFGMLGGGGGEAKLDLAEFGAIHGDDCIINGQIQLLMHHHQFNQQLVIYPHAGVNLPIIFQQHYP